MALTRKMLKAMGIEEEKIDQIIEAHSETVEGLKEELTAAKEGSKELPSLQKKLEVAEKELEAAKEDGWKDKHDSVKKEFDDYKAAQTAKEARSAKKSAYMELLKAANIGEKFRDDILRIEDLDGLELKDGKFTEADKLTEAIKEKYGSFVVKTETTGAQTSTPPANSRTGAMTKQQIMGIKDRTERRAAIAENMSAFVKGE